LRVLSPFAFAWAGAFAAAAAPASAGTLEVNPVLLEINSAHRTATVNLRNDDAVPVTIRTYALEWRQSGGEEDYADTSAVIVSPPIFTIAPGATQLVRVGLRTPASSPQAYRLVVEEVPEAGPAGGIRVALRINLPLYAWLSAGQASALRWSARRDGDGGWTLEAANEGAGYVRLDPSLAEAAIGVRVPEQVTLGTLLPGATRRWHIAGSLDVRNAARFREISTAQAHAEVQASRN
jgi:fimbrial chaperone protein